jgi:hypothetical protein
MGCDARRFSARCFAEVVIAMLRSRCSPHSRRLMAASFHGQKARAKFRLQLKISETYFNKLCGVAQMKSKNLPNRAGDCRVLD